MPIARSSNRLSGSSGAANSLSSASYSRTFGGLRSSDKLAVAFRRRLEYHASQGRVAQTARRLSKTYRRKIPVVKYGRQYFQYGNQQDCHSPHCKCSADYRIGRIPHRPLCSQSEGDSSCVGKWAYVPPSQAHDRLDLHAQSLGTIVPHALRETSFISCCSTNMTRPWQPISCTNVGSRVCAGVGAPGGLTTVKRPYFEIDLTK